VLGRECALGACKNEPSGPGHRLHNKATTFFGFSTQPSTKAPESLQRSTVPLIIASTRPSTSHTAMAEGIDRREDQRLEFSTSKEVTVAPTFEAMQLKENLLRGIYAYGYESPSAVQSRAIVQICKGRDTIAQAQSGTGKTATFSISILQVIDTAVRETQGSLFIATPHYFLFVEKVSSILTVIAQHWFSPPPANSRLRSSPWSWLWETI
jgi:hypothetical protein